MTTPSNSVTLILLAGGGLCLNQRLINGVWASQNIGDGELILQSGTGPLFEVRWDALSTAPTYTLHIHLLRSMLWRTAGELTDRDPGSLVLTGGTGIQDPLLTQIGLALWRELAQNASADKLYAQTAAQMIAVHLLRHYLSIDLRINELKQGLTHAQLQRVRDFITADLGRPISLIDLAQQIGFSSYHFARLFRQTAGESPHQFVLRQRIDRAQHLLKTSKLSLIEIALDCGFANQSHLTRLFKRNLGITPRAYRQMF